MNNKMYSPQIPNRFIMNNLNQNNLNFNINNNNNYQNNHSNNNDAESRRSKLNSKSEKFQNNNDLSPRNLNDIQSQDVYSAQKSVENKINKFSKSQTNMISEVVNDNQNIHNVKGKKY